jgi:hypothetical protein
LSSSYFSGDEGWTFLCLTYDGTKTTDNLNLYAGTDQSSVALVQTFSSTKGQLLSYNDFVMFVGNMTKCANRPFVGFIDELRIWSGQEQNLEGVLSIDELEQVRLWDIEGCWDSFKYDLNLDCFVNLPDLADFSGDWMSDNLSDAPSDFNNDNVIDFIDMALFAEHWLYCNKPSDSNCINPW